MLTAFPLQQRLHERASMLLYTYIASLVSCVSFLYSFVICVCACVCVQFVLLATWLLTHIIIIIIIIIIVTVSGDRVIKKQIYWNLNVSHAVPYSV